MKPRLPRDPNEWAAIWYDLHLAIRAIERIKKRLLKRHTEEEEASRDLTEDIVDLDEDQLPF